MIYLKSVHWRTPLEFLVQVLTRCRGGLVVVARAQEKAYQVVLSPSYPEICRPCHRTSPSGFGPLPCQDLNSCTAREANFSSAAGFGDLNLSVRAAAVGASRRCLSSVTDPMGPHHTHQTYSLLSPGQSVLPACSPVCTSPSPTGLSVKGK